MTVSASEKLWVQQVLAKYADVDKRCPKTFDLGLEQPPEWVINLLPTMLAVSSPGLNFNRFEGWTTKDLGQFLGRQSACEGLLWDEVPLSPRVNQEKLRWLDSQPSKLRSSPKLAVALTPDLRGLKAWRRVFKRFIDETLLAARNRPYHESSAFLEAFGKGNVIKPDEFATEQKMGVGERIAYVMIHQWRRISKFESVAELHRFLSEAVKPTGTVITLKRVEKLSQRIGLRFKGRGRPKGKIQTNLPAAV